MCTLTCRLTEREEKEIEYKETVYTLAREHEKVGTLHTVLLSQATCTYTAFASSGRGEIANLPSRH